jgi:hypothetical protein
MFRRAYPHVAAWLARYLRDRFSKDVAAHDAHRIEPAAFLRAENLHTFVRGCEAYEIQVDVTGMVRTRDFCPFCIRRVQSWPDHVARCRVARPEWSFLISPAGLSDHMSSLLVTYGRQDVLDYGKNRTIRLATWNVGRREIDAPSLIPKGSHV